MAKPEGMNKIVESVIAEAEEEIRQEVVKKAKKKLKDKLRERTQAAKILSNIEREINVIKLEIGHDLGE